MSDPEENGGLGVFITLFLIERRVAYLVHPAHLAFLKLAQPKIEKAFGFDYAPEDGLK